MPKMPEELKMSFDPNTIEHLGVRMYSTLPPVLAELIANAYDADAASVSLTLNDKGEKEIIIEDDGVGMSFEDINTKFLRIGRPRRQEENTQVTGKNRKVIGKKGLGKLSFFGIAHEIEIATKKDGKENVFGMSWEDIKKEKGEYKPKVIKRDVVCSAKEHGTKITLRKIQRASDFSPEDIADALSKMFIIDSDFEISLRHNSEKPITITNERRYSDLEKEVEWKIPADSEYKDDYDKANQIVGHLIATKKPIPPKTSMRGVILFSRKKMVNIPEYFSDSTSSHFFSYLTGWLEVDFIDDLEEDVIATNRQSLNWGNEEMQKLRSHLRGLMNWLERDWRKKREAKRQKEITEATGINISDWFSKLPEDIRKKIEPIVRAIIKDSELPEEINKKAVIELHGIAPEYPLLHWRHLHPEIQRISKEYYEKQDYWHAATEAVKHYISGVRGKSGSTQINDQPMMGESFGKDSSLLLVTANSDMVENDIEDGQKFLSMGIVAGFKNPVVSHSTIESIKARGLFDEKDCLDILSLLSHLQKRLDNGKKR